MKKAKWSGGTLLVVALLAALATLLIGSGGSPAAAQYGGSALHVTAQTSIDRVCSWTVEKNGPTHLTLAVNEAFDVPYDVIVTKRCTDTIHVHGTVDGEGNPDKVDVTLDSTVAAVSCSHDELADTFHCTYDGHPSSTAPGTVHAVATYHDLSTATGDAPYSFDHAPVTVAEDSVDVFDSYAGTLAVHLDHSATFHYTRRISFDHCGHFVIENTARVVDGTELAHVTHTLVVDVPCGTGCTLTQGYWKTHSKYGPAPSDPAWNNVTPSGPDTTFFLSGKTWYQVFNTPPQGNAYYILAVQFMAAKLNILNGASSTAAVNSALSWATTFFNTYTPAQIGALAKSSSLRATAISNASTLEGYNSGATGPGHCSE